MTYPPRPALYAGFVVSIVTVNCCVPSAVCTVAPTGTRTCWVVVNREKVTIPVAATAGKRVTPKSATQESRSAPLDVAARVIASTCNNKPSSHTTTAAFASTIARNTDPTVRSTSTFA